METKNVCSGNCGGASCDCSNGKMGMCGHMGMCGSKYGVYRLLKMLLVIFILCFVFNAGVRFGEMKGALESGNSYGHHFGGRVMMMTDAAPEGVQAQ